MKFADPTFVYEQQQARVFGLEILHMADADVLPYDYRLYGKDILNYVKDAERQADKARLKLDFAPPPTLLQNASPLPEPPSTPGR